MNHFNAKDIVELLNVDRDYHNKHPKDAFYGYIYALIGTIASVVASVYISEKVDLATLRNIKNIGLVFTFVFLGIISIVYGLLEHSSIHGQQRKRIEDAINYIMDNAETFDYSLFWKSYKSHHLKTIFGKPLKNPTYLFALEPDTRGFWSFHDRKIEFGALLVLVGYFILIYNAFF